MAKIKIYSTATCVFCRAEKQFLDEHDIKYDVIMVDEDQAAAEEMIKRSGQMGVPFTVITQDDGTEIDAHLATQPRGLRISELIAMLGAGWEEGRVRRLNQWMLLDGARCEPLEGPPGATSAPHASARAS